MTGQNIRIFFRQLLGSRIAEQLELELLRTRQNYEHRLQERDSQISELRSERDRLRAKLDEYEADPSYYWWLSQRTAQRARPPQHPDFQQITELPPAGSWARIQHDWYEQQTKEAAAEAAAKETQYGVREQRQNEEIREPVS